MENNEIANEFIDNEFEEIIDDNDDLILDNNDPKKIFTDRKDFTIFHFQTMFQDGDLILRPEYQRKFVMDVKLCSRLVESLLMDVPIPVLYLSEEIDGKFSVIDGQQRLTSFISFMNGKFPRDSDGIEKDFSLKGLNVLTNLINKKFINLEKAQQNKIKTSTLNTIIIRKESPEDIKFEIFERLNTGSIRLNEDEIRNTIYRGNYIRLLAELEDNETFHKIVNRDKYKRRMIYRGMILRFFALSEKTYINYKPSIKQFCNKELRDNQKMNSEKQKEYKDKFKKCIELVYTVFGLNAFRRFSPGNNQNPNGKWNLTSLNMALFDIQMCGFVNYERNQIIPNADAIRERLIYLMSYNDDFIDAIEKATSDRNQVTKRFEIWLSSLKEIIGNPQKEPRIFPFSIKKQLFNENPKCTLCNQQILHIDDAEVDHITPYSEGGKTEIINAQITHRYCNRKKLNKISIQEEQESQIYIDIFAKYNDNIIHAKLNPINHSVIYKDKHYSSPSGAGTAAKIDCGAHNDITTNGWQFWKYYKQDSSEECYIDDLRNM